MIYLYRDILPNYDNNTHIMYNNIDDYIAYLGAPYLSFEENRYTLNGNIAEVTIGIKTDIDHITYIAWNNNGMWRFYHVLSAVNQSGYAIFNLDVDLWGTFISYAQFSKIRVSRCNRLIDNGVYDSITATTGYNYERIENQLSETDFSIVYLVAWSVGESTLFENKSATALALYVNPITDFEGRPEGSLLEWYINAVSGIYATWAELPVDQRQANVLKAYILPTSVIKAKGGTVPRFLFSSPNYNGDLVPNGMVDTAEYIKTVSIRIDADKSYRVGTKYAGLDLLRTVYPASVDYKIITKHDGLQIIVQQGDRMLDITNSFEIGLTRNDGNVTAQERIANILQVTTGVASGVFQIASGGAGYVTGAMSIAGSLLNTVKEGNARYTPAGDGISTICNRGVFDTPFYIRTSNSIIDEQRHARQYGAIFDTYITDLSNIFTPPLIGTGEINSTYIAADLCVDNIPASARDLIVSTFARGVYLNKLESSNV